MNSTASHQEFVPLPSDESLRIAWPTPNYNLLVAPEKFFARTRVNPDYGKPGWTRDCGRRFHRGCDIAPVSVTATGKTTRVIFTDCATQTDFESTEPTFIPHDEVFVVYSGEIVERVTDESVSDFGKHIVIAHHWPHNGEKFFTVYGHLSELEPKAERSETPRARAANRELKTGDLLGHMGQTSRSADAHNWMLIAPHLHFEVRNAENRHYDPAEFLRRFCQ